VADGGKGPVWVITLAESAAPAGREGLEWRIANSLISTDTSVDFEALGVAPNDRLDFQIERTDTQRKGTIPCTVLGAVKNKVAFLLGTDPQDITEQGGLNDAEIFVLAFDLRVPLVTINPETGELSITGDAAEIQVLLNSLSFKTDNYNLPFSSDTEISLDLFNVLVSGDGLTRNCRIPVDETVASVPALFEYIAKPEVGEDGEGNIILVGRNSSEKVLDEVPVVFLENRDYTVGGDRSVSGANAETTAGSAIIRLPFADLLDRDIRIGDDLDLLSGFDQDRYNVVEVLDDETVRVLSLNGEVPSNTATGLRYELIRRTPGKFLRFVEGMFTPSAPAPERLWAETTFFDNAPYIEDNFGSLVNVTKEQLDEFGSSQVSYKGAVSGLMYAWTTGATLTNAAIGSHLLLGLPVTEVAGQVIDVNDAYEPSRGRIMIEDLDRDGALTGLVRIYFYTPESVGESQFAGLSINPATGRTWEIGDFVPPFTPISNGVIVEDYVTNPTWWQVGGATGAEELKKYHTWQAAIDVLQIDSRDIGLVSDYLFAIRPMNTKPEVIATLFLADEVRVEDSISLYGSLFLFDDPAFSIESTHMVDSMADSHPLRFMVGPEQEPTPGSGSFFSPPYISEPFPTTPSGDPARIGGSIGLRVMFRGDDLEVTEGSPIVTSARGGFTEEGTLPYINQYFEDPVTVWGSPLVRVGDFFHILQGPNRGRFLVKKIYDDNTLELEESFNPLAPRTFDPVQFQEESGALFYVERLDQNPIAEGDDMGTAAGSRVVESISSSFKWDGVAVDDWLLLLDGTDYNLYRITSVGIATIDAVGELALEALSPTADDTYIVSAVDGDGTLNPGAVGGLAVGNVVRFDGATWTRMAIGDGTVVDVTRTLLEIDGVLTTTESNLPFRIERDALQRNPLFRTEDGSSTAGSKFLTIFGIGADPPRFLRVRPGDEVRILSGPDSDRVVKVIDTPADFTLALAESLTFTGGIAFEINRENLYYSSPNSDFTFECMHPNDQVDLVILRPWSVFLSVVDLALAVATATSAGTDLAAAGVTTAMFLQVDNAHTSSGVYEITNVSGFSVDVATQFPVDEGPVGGEFLVDVADFSVSGDTVTSVSLINYETLGIIPGDILEVLGAEFVILEVSGTTLTLTKTTGVVSAEVGRIIRRLYPC
jgi:hypothetical protein